MLCVASPARRLGPHLRPDHAKTYIGSVSRTGLAGECYKYRPQVRRCNPAVYTIHDAGQIVDQTAPFARLTAHALYPEQWSKRMYVWNPKVTTAAPAYIPTTNIAQRGMDGTLR
jgi:hypothetical protein